MHNNVFHKIIFWRNGHRCSGFDASGNSNQFCKCIFIDKKKLNKTKFLSFRSIKMYKNNSGKRPILGNGFLGFDFLENVLQSARERFVFIMFDVVMCFQ